MLAKLSAMKKLTLLLMAITLTVGLSCCTGKKNKVLLHRDFPTLSWERFDFVKDDIEVTKPTPYDLVMDVCFDPSYTYNYFSVVFTVFDSYGNPFRTKDYKFFLKEKDGSWKSTLVDGYYHFTFPINSALTINEPGIYNFQLENRMPITPLYGVKEVSIINNK